MPNRSRHYHRPPNQNCAMPCRTAANLTALAYLFSRSQPPLRDREVTPGFDYRFTSPHPTTTRLSRPNRITPVQTFLVYLISNGRLTPLDSPKGVSKSQTLAYRTAPDRTEPDPSTPNPAEIKLYAAFSSCKTSNILTENLP